MNKNCPDATENSIVDSLPKRESRLVGPPKMGKPREGREAGLMRVAE
jgi:hypothetical protein